MWVAGFSGCDAFVARTFRAGILTRRPRPSIAALDQAELVAFAGALRDLLVRYDNLWQMPFPNLRKYPAGPEIGAGSFLMTATPEDKAAELRAVETVHYASGR
jgi:UDPglucose--hexose-1-phosphate uridylyltransferase